MKKKSKFGIGLVVLALALLAIVYIFNRDDGELTAPTMPAPPPTEPSEPPVSQSSEAPAPSDLPSPTPALETEPEPIKIAEPELAEMPPVAQAEPAVLADGPFTDSESVRAQETMKIDPPIREIGRAWIDDSEQRNNFSMPVSGGRDLKIEVDRFEALGQDGGEFIGKVKGAPGSSVRLSYRGRAEAGTIRLPSENRIYRILPGQSGEVVVQERNLAMDEPPVRTPPEMSDLPPVPNFTPPPPPEGLVEPASDEPGR